MRCGVYSLHANYTQTVHEAYIGGESKRLRDKETKRGGGEGESKRQRVKETKRGRDGEWERGRLSETMGRLRKTMGRLSEIRGRLRKI